MIKYSTSIVIDNKIGNYTVWKAVTIRPTYPIVNSSFEEGLSFILSYIICEIIRTKRDTYFIAIF